MKHLAGRYALVLASALAAASTGTGWAQAPDRVEPAGPLFARVNGVPVTVASHDALLTQAIREKYYHRRPPEEQLAGLKREVGERLVERVLLLAEAQRQGLQPDADAVRRTLEQIEQRYQANPRWQAQREQLLPEVERELRENDLLEQIEKSARQVPEPSQEALRRFYDSHREAFTQPERVRLSIILLKIDPGLPRAEKDKFHERAQALHARLLAGEDFAALAKEHSGDASAANGGDMGYVHAGTLGTEVHNVIGKLTVGAISEPIALMEGVAILRLDERVPAELKRLDESRERATKLWQRDAAEERWRQLKQDLRKSAKVEILDASRYPEPQALKP